MNEIKFIGLSYIFFINFNDVGIILFGYLEKNSTEFIKWLSFSIEPW
jgi:hypothetical protein